MARKQFVIVYPDRSKENVSRTDRDSLLLSRQIEPISPEKYRYIGEVKTFHAFSDLAGICAKLPMLRRYLEGLFIFEFQGKQHRERLETPEAFAFRLQLN